MASVHYKLFPTVNIMTVQTEREGVAQTLTNSADRLEKTRQLWLQTHQKVIRSSAHIRMPLSLDCVAKELRNMSFAFSSCR